MLSVTELSNLAKDCSCGNDHFECTIEEIVVSHDALEQASSYMRSKSYRKVSIVADKITFNVAGQKLSDSLNASNVETEVVLIQPNEQGDVIANEIALIEAMLGISQDSEVVIAVGSGTIHDITRFSSFKMGKPFISVPTAPSVDGFNSMGAPVVIKGVKTTYQMQSPIAIFADLTILKEAPQEMIAAGFGDMLAKFTSLADWRFSHLTAGEPYCSLSASITEASLKKCVDNVDLIAAANEEGIRILIESLIESGLAMLLVGHSSPASGGEHHLSHYWEMEFLKQDKPQVLHGAKVGVSTQLILKLYKNDVKDLISNSTRLAELKDKQKEIISAILEKQEEIQKVIDSLPNEDTVADLLNKVKGPTQPSDLKIDAELVQNSLNEAHLLRNRYTMLKFWNELVGTHHAV